MVINGFNDQIQLVGGDNKIQGDWFMTDAKGTSPDWNPNGASPIDGEYAQIGIDLESSGNQIGGANGGEGNLFALSWASPPGANQQTRAAAAIYDGVQSLGGNVIQGNDVGIRAGAEVALVGDPPKGAPDNFDPEPALYLNGAQTIGGPGTGAGNRVTGSIITGASTIQGNTFYGHTSVLGAANVGGPVSTPGAGAGNTFEPLERASVVSDELSDSNANAVIQGNLFKDSQHVPITAGVGVGVDGATIGGPLAADANLFSGLQASHGAVWVYGSHDVVQNDQFMKNATAGIQVDAGSGNTITEVSMQHNDVGIELGHAGFLYNTKDLVNPSGPNEGEPYPIIMSDQESTAGSLVSGISPQSGTLIISLYAQASCGTMFTDSTQGFLYMGSQTVSSSFGNLSFTLTYPPLPSDMSAITMTATGSDGSTSEFSPCLSINSKVPSFLASGVIPTSSRVPVLAVAKTASIAPHVSGARSESSGRAAIELLCPSGAQSPCAGTAVLKLPGTHFHDATLAQVRFSMPTGAVSPVILTLNRGIFATLRKVHRIVARLTTNASDASGVHVVKSFALTLT